MWNQAYSQSADGSCKAMTSKRAALQILPCTVSQLLSASEVTTEDFVFYDWELNQVSVVGIIRGVSHLKSNIKYSVDDMTGPPLNVKQWLQKEDHTLFASPGTYVKVIGRLCKCSGQRSLKALKILCIKDLNEITSHMLEVVQVHMQLFGKVFDVNMNATVSSLSAGCPEGVLPNGLSTIQKQVLHVIRKFPRHGTGISFHDLKMQLAFLSMTDISSSLSFLLNEGHVFPTIDEHHFKSAEY